MSDASSISRPAIAGSVLRDADFTAHPLSLGGRPRKVAVAAAAAQTAVAHDETAMAQISQRAWKAAHIEGLAAGRREGAEAARTEVLAGAKELVAQALQSAVADSAAHVEQEAALRWKTEKKRLDDLVSALRQQLDQRLEAAQDDLLALCMDAVTHILGEAVVHPAHIRSAVEQAVARLRGRPLMKVELNPADLANLKAMPDWAAWSQGLGHSVEWAASPRVLPGGCTVSSPDGSLDARLETQIRAFGQVLLASRSATPVQSVPVEPLR